MAEVYRIAFQQDIPSREIEDALFWAVFNTESVFGKAKVRLDGDFDFNHRTKVCEISTGTDVGEHIAKMFTRLAATKFGESAFHVERMEKKEEGHGKSDS